MNTTTAALPQVNGVVLAYPNEGLPAEALRQRACAELLRQAAIRAGLLSADDPLPLGGAMTEAASSAIEALLDRELQLPEPSEEALRRHHAAPTWALRRRRACATAPRAVCGDAWRGRQRAAPAC